MKPSYVYRAHPAFTYSGDTFAAVVDLGFRAHLTITVRLHHVKATPGAESRQFLTDLLGERSLILRSYQDAASHSRWVCDVFLPDDDVPISHRIIHAGYGERCDPMTERWTD